MAKAARKPSKHKRQRPAPRAKRKRRSSPTKRRREDVRATEELAAAIAHLRSRLDETVRESVAALDFTDAVIIRGGSPVPDAAAALPELVVLQHMVIDRFDLRSGSPHPVASIKTIMGFLMSVRLSNGKYLSERQAAAMATFVRPLDAMAGGRPRKTPKPAPAVSEEG